jgi:hypothetical protein
MVSFLIFFVRDCPGSQRTFPQAMRQLSSSTTSTSEAPTSDTHPAIYHQNPNSMRHDFGLPNSQSRDAVRMPSMIEISRAEEALLAASSVQQNPQFVSLQQHDFNSRFNKPHPLSQWGGPYNPTPLWPGDELNSDLQRQALSLATPSQQQQGGASPVSMLSMQQLQQSLQLQNMVMESLLARQQQEERRLMDFSFSPSQTTWPGSVRTQVSPFVVKVTQALPKQPRQKERAKTFPVKLMEAITAHYDEDIVSWFLDGKSFVVVNPDLFVDVILKQTFKNCKYASFVRKLNRWGFSRHTSGADCFYHPLFQYDRMDLCAQLVYIPRNGRSRKKQAPFVPSAGVHPSATVDAYKLSRGDNTSLAGAEK